MSDCEEGVNDLLKESLEKAYEKGFKCGREKGQSETPVWVVTSLYSGRHGSSGPDLVAIYTTEKAAMQAEARLKQQDSMGIHIYQTQKYFLDPVVIL